MKEDSQLVFILATKPTDSPANYSLRLTVDSANTRANPAATQTLTTNIALQWGAALQTGSPPGAPIISADDKVMGGQRVYVLVMRR